MKSSPALRHLGLLSTSTFSPCSYSNRTTKQPCSRTTKSRVNYVALNTSFILTRVQGIHGRPYIPWDGVQGDNNEGYCTHTSILFPTWHRPYLGLFEVRIPTQSKWSERLKISSKSSGTMLYRLPRRIQLHHEASIKQLRKLCVSPIGTGKYYPGSRFSCLGHYESRHSVMHAH